MAQLASLYASLTLESQSFHVNLKKAADATQRDVGKIQKTLSGLKTGLAGVALAVAGSGLLSAGREALDYAAGLGELSQQLGVTTRDLQVYRYIATQAGLGQDEMDKALQRLTRTIGEADAGGKKQATTFRDLGVAVRDANGNVKTAGELMPEVADAISQLESEATRGKVAYDLFGKSGQQMLPVLEQGAEGINRLTAEAMDLGVVMGDDLIAKADLAADRLAALELQLRVQFATVVAENADGILNFANSFVSLVSGIGDAISWLRNFAVEGRKAVLAAQGWTIFGNPAAGGSAAAARWEHSLLTQKQAIENFGTTQLQTLKPVGGGALPTVAGGKKSGGRSAKPERDRTEEYRERWASEMRGLWDQELSLQQRLTNDARERAMIEHERIDRAQVAYVFDVERQVRAGELTAQQAKELKLAYARNAILDHAQVNRELDAKLDREDLDLKNAANDNRRELLERDRDSARTAKDRRRAELALLELEYQRIRAALEAVVASRDSTEVEKDIARARLELLGTLQERDAAQVARDNAGPMGQYLDDVAKSADELNESMERAAVEGLGDLKSGLAEVAIKGGNAFDVLTSAVDRFLIKLAELAIDQGLSSLFGGGGGGGLLSSIGSLLGGAGGKFIPASGPGAIVGTTTFSKLPKLAGGGSFRVDGLGGIDRNVLSINGEPRAMVSASERVNISPSNDNRRGGGGIAQIVPSPYFDVVVDGRVVRTGGAMLSGRDRRSARAARQRVE